MSLRQCEHVYSLQETSFSPKPVVCGRANSDNTCYECKKILCNRHTVLHKKFAWLDPDTVCFDCYRKRKRKEKEKEKE